MLSQSLIVIEYIESLKVSYVILKCYELFIPWILISLVVVSFYNYDINILSFTKFKLTIGKSSIIIPNIYPPP